MGIYISEKKFMFSSRFMLFSTFKKKSGVERNSGGGGGGGGGC